MRFLVMNGDVVANCIVVKTQGDADTLVNQGLNLVFDPEDPSQAIGIGDEVNSSGSFPVVTKPAKKVERAALVINGVGYDLVEAKDGEFVLKVKSP